VTDDSRSDVPEALRIPVQRACAPNAWALVDKDDYDLVSDHRWRVVETGVHQVIQYAWGRLNGSWVPMHGLIMDPPRGMVVDHIDHNGLNNRRSNLRLATVAENTRWRRAPQGTLSRYKGVSRASRGGRWVATIQCGGIRENLGSYATEEEAARVYDHRARQLFKDFAWLNFPDEHAGAAPILRQRRTFTERRVFGLTTDGEEIVRYNPGAKWFTEREGLRTGRLLASEAADLAAEGTWFEGVRGGAHFDIEVRMRKIA
jgi:hypothetical protein